MSVLRAEAITAGYSKVPVIDGVSLEAEAGTVVALLGPNGAGKSTLLKAIFGLVRISSGRVRVGELDVTGWPTHRIANSAMAYVPQVNNVFPSMSVLENLEMGAFTRKSGVARRIKEVLDIMPELAAASTKKAGQLSGGQRNLLGIARALMLDPKVVLLDEPTAGLSPSNTRVVWEQVRLVARTGTAVVIVEQAVDTALTQADRAYVLVAGRNKLDGTSLQVAERDLSAIFLGGQGQDLTNSTGSSEKSALSNQAAAHMNA
jgi:branched-chain amino acid transport system ATP-binding protein